MSHLAGTPIFWVATAGLAALLIVASLLGRPWCRLFPARLAPVARFYLAPVLGLCTLTLWATLTGRLLPIGESPVVAAGLGAALVVALVLEPDRRRALGHALLVGAFGIACGASVLAPLFAYGGFDANNDAFTYLAHADWLQHHPFSQTLAIGDVTSLTTQVSLYQIEGLRMGASHLLALVLALLHLSWSYRAYPVATALCLGPACLAMGFPLASALRPLPRAARLGLLMLPAFSLGGLVFGANDGFLPQTLGLALGGALIFTLGPVLAWALRAQAARGAIALAVLPCAVLLAGAVYAYTELGPFLVLALLGAIGIDALRPAARSRMLILAASLLGLAVVILIPEIPRAVRALATQSHAVVGGAVDWPLAGFAAHAAGLHGGAWDRPDWQWSTYASALPFAGVAASLLVLLVLALASRPLRTAVARGTLMPAAILLAILVAAFAYFRELAANPFASGTGQSWSAFKLTEWAHPFVSVFVLLALADLCRRMYRRLERRTVLVVGVLATLGFVAAATWGKARVQSMLSGYHYENVRDLEHFYLGFRQAVLDRCPPDARIYFTLDGVDGRFRVMASLLLPDRELASDWSDDGYIYPFLRPDRVHPPGPLPGDCVVESDTEAGWLPPRDGFGQLRVGVPPSDQVVRVLGVQGAYRREGSSGNRWYWVPREIRFALQAAPARAALGAASGRHAVRVRFDFLTRAPGQLHVRLERRDGSMIDVPVQSDGQAHQAFEKDFDVAPQDLAGLRIADDDTPTPLGPKDARQASWMLRNLHIEIVHD